MTDRIFSHISGFLRLFTALLICFLCACMISLLISCGATVPKQTYLTNRNLSGISKVAVLASANFPDVSYSVNSLDANVTNTVSILLFGPVIGLSVAGLEATRRSIEDQGHAEKIGKHEKGDVRAERA